MLVPQPMTLHRQNLQCGVVMCKIFDIKLKAQKPFLALTFTHYEVEVRN